MYVFLTSSFFTFIKKFRILFTNFNICSLSDQLSFRSQFPLLAAFSPPWKWTFLVSQVTFLDSGGFLNFIDIIDCPTRILHWTYLNSPVSIMVPALIIAEPWGSVHDDTIKSRLLSFFKATFTIVINTIQNHSWKIKKIWWKHLFYMVTSWVVYTALQICSISIWTT